MIEIIEVSARDGIQNEKQLISTEDKINLISRSIDAGIRRMEVTSFVNPKRVPQMADAEDVCKNLPEFDDVTYIGLTLNRKGFDRAVAAGLDEANFVTVATDTFSQKNQGVSTREGIAAFADIASENTSEIRKAVTIGAAFGCPFEGEVSTKRLLEVVELCAAHNPTEIALADTIGVASPLDIKTKVSEIQKQFPDIPLRLHLHNTRNTGIANAWAGIEAGVTAFDSSLGGVGGCPFAPRATGNIATEDLVYMLNRAGIETNVSLEKTIEAAQWLEETLGKTLPGMVMKAGDFPAKAA